MVRILLAAIVGLAAGFLSLTFSPSDQPSARDFSWALNAANDLRTGQDPYAFEPNPAKIPYPLPVALFGLPLLGLRRDVAGALFVGSGVGMLALGHFNKRRWWFALLLMALPVVNALEWCQWSPIIAASWFFPGLGPLLVIVKPQTALPVVLAKGISWRGSGIAAVVLLASLVVYPLWPLRWLSMIDEYQSIIPIFQPWCWLLLLALPYWRDSRARLVLLMAVFPFRGAYDLVPWLLIADTATEALLLVVTSGLWVGNGAPLFLAALVIVLKQQIEFRAVAACPYRWWADKLQRWAPRWPGRMRQRRETEPWEESVPDGTFPHWPATRQPGTTAAHTYDDATSK